MNSEESPLFGLISTFALLSLFAVGGANAAVPEMHRIAVEVHHWMTEKQFADTFAIAQLSPGPNVLIVTLIGYAVAGIAGALAATVAMCVPTAGPGLYCQPQVVAIQCLTLACGDPGCAGAAVDRPDGRKRPDRGAGRRQELACRRADRNRRHSCRGNTAQSAVAAAGRRLTRLCRPDLIKTAWPD
jgi:Chromate transporter